MLAFCNFFSYNRKAFDVRAALAGKSYAESKSRRRVLFFSGFLRLVIGLNYNSICYCGSVGRAADS